MNFQISVIVALTVTSLCTKVTFSQEVLNLENNIEAHTVVVRPFLKVPLFSLSFEPKSDDTNDDTKLEDEVEYEPNVEPTFGVSIGWKDFAVSASAPLPSSEEDQKREGKTKYKEADFQMMKDYWGFDVGWSTYTGFYLSDGPGNTDSEKVMEQRPDLSKTGYFVNIFVMPFGRENENWKWNNVKGSGRNSTGYLTPIAQVSYEDFKVSSTSPMIPEAKYSLFKQDATMTTVDIHALGLAGGAIGTLAVDAMKFWMAITLGGVFHNTTIKHTTRPQDSISGTSGPNTSVRLGIDMSQAEWTLGMNMLFDIKSYALRDTELNTNTGSVTLFASRPVGI